MLGKLLKPGPRYSWKKVVFIVILSSCFVSGGGSVAYLFYLYSKHLHVTNESSVIQVIVQATSQYAPLQTACLSEVLELSQDRPVNFSRFDLEEAHERLMATQVIREALIKKIKPDILYLNYELRQPIAYLSDYTNTAIDQEGVLFPYSPFYPPRHLPHVYLGAKAPPNPWGEQLETEQLNFMRGILRRFGVGEIECIDLSQSEAPSSGTRQIVLVLSNNVILRLTPKNYAQELSHYHMLATQIARISQVGCGAVLHEHSSRSQPAAVREKACVIDLRNPDVAYINDGK